MSSASTDPIVVLQPGQRRELLPVVRGDSELLYLDQVIAGLGLSVVNDAAGGAITLRLAGREASLYHKKSLVSVGGDLRLLSAPALVENGRWLLPVDGVPRVLGPLLGEPVDWKPASRVLLLGKVVIPRIGVTTFVSGDHVRVVLDASEKVPFQVEQAEGRVNVRIARDAVLVEFQQERLTGGIVDGVQFLGGRDNLFAVELGRRFQQLKASEQDTPARLVLEFQAAPLSSRPALAPSASATPQPAAPGAPARPLIVVIDPGHGGEEVGAKGPGGNLEKDVTLAIARKLRASLSNNLGHQVFLTRDKDEDVPLDQRAAIANNYKADVFLSVHTNASRAKAVSGSEVYFLAYQASDDESRRVALAEGGEILAPPGATSSGASDLALILWDMAQAEHLEESSALASRIQEELADVTGSEGRGVKQAPFRVLVGAAMPAVLVEVAFISHPEEEKLLTSDAYQNKVAAALMRGIRRYETERQAQLGRLGALRRPTP